MRNLRMFMAAVVFSFCPLSTLANVPVGIKLSMSINPVAVIDSSSFGIAGLDSIGQEYGLLSLISLSKDPVGEESDWPNFSRLYTAHFDSSASIDSLLADYISNANVDTAFADTGSCEYYSDPLFDNQWYLDNEGLSNQHPGGSGATTDIDAQEAWEFSTGDPTIVVAILDDGTLRTHEDLQGRLWENPDECSSCTTDVDLNGWPGDRYGLDLISPPTENDPSEPITGSEHGLPICGIIAAGLNDKGVVGVAYDSKVMVIRTPIAEDLVDEGGVFGVASATAVGMMYAVQEGARIISMSFGTDDASAEIEVPMLDFLQDLANRNATGAESTLVFISTGNAFNPSVDVNLMAFKYPRSATTQEKLYIDRTRHPVGNVCYTGERASHSVYELANNAQKVSLVAPGGPWSRQPLVCPQEATSDRYLSDGINPDANQNIAFYTPFFGGTSAAAPTTAAIAALVWADDPSLSPFAVSDIIRFSAVDVISDPATTDDLTGVDDYTGYGVANAHRALLYPMLISSHGGQDYAGQTSVPIQWRVPQGSTGFVRSSIYVTYDDWQTETAIATPIQTTDTGGYDVGSYTWTVPRLVDTSDAEIRIVSWNDNHDDGDPRHYVESRSGKFSIHHEPLDWEVPSASAVEIQEAIDLAEPGDRVVVSASNDYNAFDLDKDVEIENTSGGIITIDAARTAAAYAVSVSGTGGTISGLTLKGGSSGIVNGAGARIEDCKLEDNGVFSTDGAVKMGVGGTLIDSEVTLTSGQGRAVSVDASSLQDRVFISNNVFSISLDSQETRKEAIYGDGTGVQVEGNTISFSGADAGSGVGIYLTTGANSAILRDNSITGGDIGIESRAGSVEISRNLIVDTDTGIKFFQGDNATCTENTVVRPTCQTGTTGIEVSSTFSTTPSSFSNNLIDEFETGIFFGQNISASWTVSHNAYWSSGGGCTGVASNKTVSASQVSIDLEPLYCEGKGNFGDYDQRLDSEVTTGNNPWDEQVGAPYSLCGWGTLAYDSVVVQDEEVVVLEDLIVPSGKSLTLQSGVDFLFDSTDESGSGIEVAYNELRVDGTLSIVGTLGSPVELKSETESGPYKWSAVRVGAGATVDIDHAVFENAYYGIWGATDGSPIIKNSTFESNGYDISLQGTTTGAPLIQSNTFLPGAVTSVWIDRGTVDQNQFTGNSQSCSGIQVGSNGSQASVTISKNTILGYSNGNGIHLDGSYAEVTENTIKNSKRGVYVTNGTADIGTSSSSSTNTISKNTTGIYVRCLGPGTCKTCISTPVMVRNNYLNLNGNGIIAEKTAEVDIGTYSDDGNNSILSSSVFCIWNISNCASIPAVGNWFGNCTTGPLCANGTVDTGAPLCSAPASTASAPGIEMISEAGPMRLANIAISPNPSREGVTISFDLENDGAVIKAGVYDLSGRLVKRLAEERFDMGASNLRWNGRNQKGQSVGSGVYFLRIAADGQTADSRKIFITRD